MRKVRERLKVKDQQLPGMKHRVVGLSCQHSTTKLHPPSMAHTEWLPGVRLKHSVPSVQQYRGFERLVVVWLFQLNSRALVAQTRDSGSESWQLLALNFQPQFEYGATQLQPTLCSWHGDTVTMWGDGDLKKIDPQPPKYCLSYAFAVGVNQLC